jgi:hypothetical protein
VDLKVWICSFSNIVASKMRAHQSDEDIILIDYLITYNPICTSKSRSHSLLSMSPQRPGNDGQPPIKVSLSSQRNIPRLIQEFCCMTWTVYRPFVSTEGNILFRKITNYLQYVCQVLHADITGRTFLDLRTSQPVYCPLHEH